ncbi:MAG: FtsX-like permease family protein [Bacillus sp. (in: firmicutes)]
MKKKSLYKDIVREIWHSKGRFLSILILTMLGVAFFIGLKVIGPDMLLTADQYYEKHNLADAEVQSTYGLDESDEKLLRQVPDVEEIEFGYTADVLLQDSNLVAKVYSAPLKQKINTYQIDKGRLPSKSGEIALDDKLSGEYKLGDTITFAENKQQSLSDTFHTTSYKVVGFVTSSKYIEKSERGVSSIGKGKTDAFAVISEQDFNLDVYTVANLVFKNANEAAYSASYENQIEKNIKEIEFILKDQPKERLAKIKQEAQAEIDDAEAKVNNSKQELEEQEKKLANAKQQIDNARGEYKKGETVLYNQLQTAETELNESEAQLAASKEALDKASVQIANGKEEIAAAKAEINSGESALAEKQAELDAKRQQLYQAGLLHGETLAEIQAAGSRLTEEGNKLQAAKSQLASKEAEIQEAENELAAGTEEYNEGKARLAAAKKQYEAEKANGFEELAQAKAEIDASESRYEESLALFQKEKPKAEHKIADAQAEIEQAKADMAGLELPKYYVTDRTNNPRYTDFKDNANRLTSLASIFPVLFFLIAALVCLTTMTRMVDEQRTQIGLMKALGYRNGDIIAKYFTYGSLASIIGSLFGLFIGSELFTRVMYNAYLTMYDMPDLNILYDPMIITIAVLVALLCTSVTAYVAARSILRANAATLMRPKVPKNGKRIILEQIGFIWARLNFTSKVTARNLFRYKKRMFMTIIGVAGCTALMFTGYGLRDTVQDLVPLQYNEIMKYDAFVLLENDRDASAKSYNQLADHTNNISARTSVFQTNMTALKKGVNNQEVTLMVPEEKEKLYSFITLRHLDTKKAVEIPDEGAVLSEKLADLYNVKTGDTLVVKDSNDEQFKVKVQDIIEMYAGHYIFISPSYYQSIFHEDPAYNADLLKLKSTETAWQNDFAEQLMNNGAVIAVNYTNAFSNLLQDTMDSLNVVVVVLIVSAALLAFVVLYNLSNINVSERIRELSTIKVLGFYPKEVTMYVYRENIILTILGIVIGFLFGNVLFQIVITTVEVDEVMFSHAVHWTSYAYSAALTLVFSLLVMLAMHIKLKRIDMIEALKSIE